MHMITKIVVEKCTKIHRGTHTHTQRLYGSYLLHWPVIHTDLNSYFRGSEKKQQQQEEERAYA